MTREEIIDFCEMKSQLEPENEDIFNYIIKALEQESSGDVINRQAEQFARWVAKEIFDDIWEDNPNAFDGFAELACRKLEKLGFVKANDGKWELVEPQESEG